MSPTRKANCSTRPATPARMMVFASSTSAWDSSASALAFSAGRRADTFASAPSFDAVAAVIVAWLTFDGDLEKPLDVPTRDDARVAPEQLVLGF